MRKENQKKKAGSTTIGNNEMSRRSFLVTSAWAAAGLLIPGTVMATISHRPLKFYHTHTGEKMEIFYTPELYKGSVRRALEYFLRDFRTGDVHPIDHRLLASLCAIQNCCDKNTPFEVISGYRSPKTNNLLRKKGSGVASKSLHMKGRAIDIRLSGLPTSMLRDIAVNLHKGGVGFYPKSDFVHIDTGHKRKW